MGLLRKIPNRTYVPPVPGRAGRAEFTVCASPPDQRFTPDVPPPDRSGAPRRCYTIPAWMRCTYNTATGAFNCVVIGEQEVCTNG